MHHICSLLGRHNTVVALHKAASIAEQKCAHVMISLVVAKNYNLEKEIVQYRQDRLDEAEDPAYLEHSRVAQVMRGLQVSLKAMIHGHSNESSDGSSNVQPQSYDSWPGSDRRATKRAPDYIVVST